MLQLIEPTARLHFAWLEAHNEWGPGLHEDGFGLGPSDEVDSADGFAAWLALLAEESGPRAVEAGRGCLYRWIVEGDRVHGGIVLRHGCNDFVRQFGHIGYGVRPSSRRRGLASWALGRILDEARSIGLDRVLVVCAAGNLASARTVERNGGVLEPPSDPAPDADAALRYWIGTGSAAPGVAGG